RVDDAVRAELPGPDETLSALELVDVLVERAQRVVRQQDGHGGSPGGGRGVRKVPGGPPRGTHHCRPWTGPGSALGSLPAPSRGEAVARGRPPFDSGRAAGTLLLPVDAAPGAVAAGGVLAHGAISLGWGVVLAAVLPRRHPVVWGALAGLAIAGLDLGVLA